jgi:hypothetical protein
VRSGDVSRYATAAVLVPLAGGLAGCVETTQQKNARVDLQDRRIFATRESVHVRRQDPNITVRRVRMLRSRSGVAVAVTLRNEGSTPVSDLPISVGVSGRRRRTSYLNAAPELPYFQTHIAGVAARGESTWVFSRRRPAPGGRAFARVGAPEIEVAKGVSRVPAIASSLTSVGRHGGGRASAVAEIGNSSGVSQPELEVYAYALAGDRLVAAGSASLRSLESGARRTLQIPLLGDPGSSAVQLQAPPTNLR